MNELKINLSFGDNKISQQKQNQMSGFIPMSKDKELPPYSDAKSNIFSMINSGYNTSKNNLVSNPLINNNVSDIYNLSFMNKQNSSIYKYDSKMM